jgi:hypothetical protein
MPQGVADGERGRSPRHGCRARWSGGLGDKTVRRSHGWRSRSAKVLRHAAGLGTGLKNEGVARGAGGQRVANETTRPPQQRSTSRPQAERACGKRPARPPPLAYAISSESNNPRA